MMIRKNVSLTPRQDTALKKESERLGISFSDVLRRILDEYLKHKK